jgi:pimeloyl-ACP methyl ester carboxylesterase
MRTHAAPLAAALLLAATHAYAASEPVLRRAGFIGVQVAPPEPEASPPGTTPGVQVRGLVEGGSAIAAGLRAGDVIVALDGAGVADTAGFARRVGALRAGDVASLEVRRGGTLQTLRVVVRPRPMEAETGATTEYRALAVDGGVRRTFVTRPQVAGRHPAVLYLTGIGCFSQESVGAATTEAKLLYGLTRAGFVTMRVEKSGIGDGQGTPCDADASDLDAEVRGYAAGLRALREYDFVDPGRVFVLGLSIGGVEAPLVAAGQGVRGVVVVNTVARAFLDYLQDIRRTQGALRGTPYDALEADLRVNAACNRRLLVDREDPAHIVAADPRCRDWIAYPAPVSYMRQWSDLNLAAAWKRVDAPVLVLHGASDWVASAVDGPYLRDMLETFRPGRATFVEVPDMDHVLSHAASLRESVVRGLDPAAPYQEALTGIVSDWMQRQMASGTDRSRP